MLSASPGDPTPIAIPGQAGVVQVLGMNALAATEVPSASPSLASMTSAVPWMSAQGGVTSLSDAQGGIVIAGQALSAGPLGSLNPMARASHSSPGQPVQEAAPTADESQSAFDASARFESLAVKWHSLAPRAATITAPAADAYFASVN